jgi:tetratricopeptide (TPR) repeat protein
MFRLFRKKENRYSVTPEDKIWVENNVCWLIENFGLKKPPFLVPEFEFFPYTNLRDEHQFKALFNQLCGYWGISPDEIIISFFDDIKSMQWSAMSPEGELNEPAGIYSQVYTTEKKRFRIELAKSNLENLQLLISVIAHELAHVKLLGGNYVKMIDADMEQLTDVATIFFGFGIFLANTCQVANSNWIGRKGYLPNEVISYTNALLCHITGEEADVYCKYLNTNTNELFRQDYQYLVSTEDTLLTKYKIAECEIKYNAGLQITEGFCNRAFDDVIEGCKKLLEINPADVVAYNNIGYAQLLQKDYSCAAESFTKAIEINPYWDYPVNNRGYCRLQLGDMDNALADIQSSFWMNPDNSFSWRNFGAYYLVQDEPAKALEYVEQAQKIDPETEMINFYLAHIHFKLGNSEKARIYMEKSRELDEYNDTVIDGWE